MLPKTTGNAVPANGSCGRRRTRTLLTPAPRDACELRVRRRRHASVNWADSAVGAQVEPGVKPKTAGEHGPAETSVRKAETRVSRASRRVALKLAPASARGPLTNG